MNDELKPTTRATEITEADVAAAKYCLENAFRNAEIAGDFDFHDLVLHFAGWRTAATRQLVEQRDALVEASEDARLASDGGMSRWFRDRRQEFIAATLRQFGQIRRADLVRQFDISVPQAAKDIADFMASQPAGVRYDVSAKCYVFEEEV